MRFESACSARLREEGSECILSALRGVVAKLTKIFHFNPFTSSPIVY